MGTVARIVDGLSRAIRTEPSMLLVLLVGVVFLAVQTVEARLPDYVRAGLFVVGTGMTAVASARVGGTYFSEQRERHARAMAKVAFRRTLGLFVQLDRASGDVRDAAFGLREERDEAERVPYLSVEAALHTISVRLADGSMQFDDALAEWEEIIPEDAREMRARLAEES